MSRHEDNVIKMADDMTFTPFLPSTLIANPESLPYLHPSPPPASQSPTSLSTDIYSLRGTVDNGASTNDGFLPDDLLNNKTQPTTSNVQGCTSANTAIPLSKAYGLIGEDDTEDGASLTSVSQGDRYEEDDEYRPQTGNDKEGSTEFITGDCTEESAEENTYSGSDSSSDVYMQSDSIDTLDSLDSETCLLKHHNDDDDDDDNDGDITLIGNYLSDDQPASPYQDSNPGYVGTESNKSSVNKNTAHLIGDDVKASCVSDTWVDGVKGEVNTWMTEEGKDLADDEDDDSDEGTHLEESSTLQRLLPQLAGHHPGLLASITIQVLDSPEQDTKSESLNILHKPAHESLNVLHKPTQESLRLPQTCLPHSTESLNTYKLSKQGIHGNSMRVQAIHNWRAQTMDNIHDGRHFVKSASASVSNLGHVCQKALSYVRADMEFGSRMSVGDSIKSPSLLAVGGGHPPGDSDSTSHDSDPPGQASVTSGRHMRNLLLISLLITIFFVANFATRNLQSSLNQDGAVGVICLAVMFVFYILGSLISPVLVQGLGVKSCIVGGLVFQLVYVAANLYPVLWLMVPASMGGGASLAIIWNAMSTYVVMLAKGEAAVKRKSYERVSDKFFGIFCLIYQSNLIIGNLIAALVLSYGDGGSSSMATLPSNTSLLNSTATNVSAFYFDDFTFKNLSAQSLENMLVQMDDNETRFTNTSLYTDKPNLNICGTDFCHHYVIEEGSSSVSRFTIFLLFGIFMLLIVICIFIGLFLLEPLSPYLLHPPSNPWRRVKQQVVSLAKFSRNTKFLLLVPLMLFSVMQYSFVSSEVTVAFVTCPIGVWMVGYAMMAYGAFCSVGSYVCQALSPRIGRGFFVGLASNEGKGVNTSESETALRHGPQAPWTESVQWCL